MAKITLDTTLADLYREHGIKGPFITTTHCVFGHMDLHPEIPRELVFPEDEEPVPYSDDENEKARLRQIILNYKPLRRVFGVGDMEVIFFSPSVSPEKMERDVNQLPENQRHRARMIDLTKGNVPDQLLEATKGKTLVFWRPQGWMRDHKCLVDPTLAYHINSKDYLITSGMHTPPSEVVSLEDISRQSIFGTRPLPFAVKLLKAGCSFGTFLVTSEQKRDDLLAALPVYKKRGTTVVVLSDYISPKLDLAVHFFIGAPDSERNRSNPLILATTVQRLTPDGKWVGGHVDYRVQEDLRKLVWDTVVDTTKRIPEEFVGWAGVDIIVDDQGSQWVVDLNARYTGSLPICFMSGHFWKERGLPLVEFGTFEYPGETDGIYSRLGPMLESGQIIVTATASIGETNMADIVWGAKGEIELAEIGTFIKTSIGSSASQKQQE
ncbi:hypothetical protein VHEMI00008 [[Torrubiella] hemipterigena]|uniref:ATP-grasp domain-containing protein n=1 Tax=[Torrubiella] hemipterigena TaxID=1531966 RepID=A0A0A1T365_9HYPO|nr:hypothetical protein VHEMI00008 [[Torrubiella] hemipterigena]